VTGRRPPISRSALGLGLGFLALYAAVAVATQHLSPWPLRPLFDGFHPPAYRWVKPPKQFAAGNVPPTPAQATVALQPAGSDAGRVFTPEGQALLTLEAGTIAPHPPDTSVDLSLTAFDATTLGRLPPTLELEGNAYRVTFTYRPSGVDVTGLARQPTITLVPARLADHLLYSPDGKAWTETGSKDITFALDAPAPGPGYFVVASSPDAREAYGAQEAAAGKKSRGPIFYLSLALVPLIIASALTRKPAFLWPARSRRPAPRQAGGKRRLPPKRKKRRPAQKHRRR
jgi:hypothetical protein